jgi:hypothetical protein
MNSINLGGILADKDKLNYLEIIHHSVTFFHTSVVRKRQLSTYLSNVTSLVRQDICKLEKGIFVSGQHFTFKVDWIFRRTVRHVTHYVLIS